MTPKTLRIIIAIFLFIHAIGHGQGIIVSLELLKLKTWNMRSWLFDNLMGEKASRMPAMIM
jgi:hypothetical protein